MVIYAHCTSSKNINNNNNNKQTKKQKKKKTKKKTKKKQKKKHLNIYFLKTGTDYVGRRHFVLAGSVSELRTQLRSATKRFLVTYRCIAKRYEALCNACVCVCVCVCVWGGGGGGVGGGGQFVCYIG